MKRSTYWIVFLIVIATVLAPRDTAAQSDRAGDDKTLSPYFFVEGGDPAVDQLPLKQTHVDVAIAGVIADVTVRQVYENRGTRPIHARYVFPASTRAAVYGMTMTVGNVRTVARIKERQQAAREFEAAKQQGKSASLLEQSRANVFSMKVANVLPGDTITVELKYTELLVPTDGVYEFVYPTVVGPRYSSKTESQASPADAFVKAPYTHQGEAPRSEFHLSGVVSTGVPLQELTSPSHALEVRYTAPGRAEMTQPAADLWSGNKDFILRYRLSGTDIGSGLLLYQGATENFFLLMAEPPQVVQVDQVPPREYVFVLDVSGSMNGFPLDTAKKLMSDLAGVLRPSDTFNVVVFADGSETFAPASVPATRANLARALAFIGAKNGGGGTELLSAIKRTVNLPRKAGVSRSLVLVTDGYIEAEAEVFDYIREHVDDTNVFAFGIGSSVNRLLIEGVARAGLGEPFIVTGTGEATDAAGRLKRYIETPVLTGIDVTFNGFDAYDVEPGRVPDLFASRPIVVFGKWRGRASGAIEISGRTGWGEYRTTVPVSLASADSRHAALRYLWARTRIADMSDFGPAALTDDRVADITSLGLTYGLLTRYTSFVAVQEIVRTKEAGDDVDQPLPLPEGASDLAVGVTQGPEPGVVWLFALVVALLGGAQLLAWRRRRSGAVS
ncbi:MAG TPA: VIT and VWA domain-containing protein [Vicinamibacterales bacterium]|jgi:Ca-activated chloride channel family protein|nr:VIT and VWA domain-containing protein [Vicinamibacterales bacterium]